MTRNEVLTILGRLTSLRRKGIDPAQIPVQFQRKRIAVLLPASSFSPDEQIRLEGKFQFVMSQQHVSAYLDFTADWHGLASHLSGGFD